jgi:hypothetical protein
MRMTAADDSELATYIADRDAMLRALDPAKCIEHFKKWHLPQPPGGWSDPIEVPLVMMHKCRLEVPAFSNEERAFSHKWLAARGYTRFGGLPL